MVAEEGPILLINRGDLPALTAATIQPDPSRLLLWHLKERDRAAPRRLAAVRKQRELIGAADLIVSEPWQAPDGRARDTEGLAEALMLVQAAIVARRRGCELIVWPVQIGPEADGVCQAVDRATVVSDLAEIGGGRSIVIDLPLADLDDRQVVDLADDCGAPLGAFWPCETDRAEPCGACGGCDRWRRAFEKVGLPWPWEKVKA